MASSDFTLLQDSAPVASINRAVTFGTARPPGGGNFVLGFASKTSDSFSAGFHANQAGFNPSTAGGSIRFATKRGKGGIGFAALGFVGSTGDSVNDTAYVIGLSDEEPSNIILRKGVLSSGVPPNAPGDPITLGTLRRSIDQFEEDTWVHLRLDMIVNGNGDVILAVFQNDLTLNEVSSPIWIEVPGVDDFIDDALEVNSGSPPLVDGRAGVAFTSTASARRGYFDYFRYSRQLVV